MKPCKFTFDDTPAFDGFSHESKWNGFDNVCVTPETRQLIADYFRSDSPETADDFMAIDIMDADSGEGKGLISLGWGYCTTIVPNMPEHFNGAIYIVRDRATQGTDFILWGENREKAITSYNDALRDGLNVELIMVENDSMDEHTSRLIYGEDTKANENEFKDILDILAKADGAVLYWQMPKGAKAALDAGVVTIDENDLMVHPNAIGPDENGQYTMPISD